MRLACGRILWATKGSLIFSLALSLTVPMLRAQDAPPAPDNSSTGWQRYDWLKPAAAASTVSVTTGSDLKDPFTVVTNGTLWQDKYDAVYTRRLADSLLLTSESSTTTMGSSMSSIPGLGMSDDLTHGQTAGLQYQPGDQMTLRANLHDSVSGSALPGDTYTTSGTALSADGHLPMDSTLSLSYRADRSSTDAIASPVTDTTAYDAQFKQPLGKLPITALLKGHYETVDQQGSTAGHLPSLEQSLVWKPLQDTTIQMGLRQQQYQEYPGVDNQFNQAIFADWSQKMANDISWHSYAEVLNSRGMIDQAPAAPITSGTGGSAQATTPGRNISPTSSVPLSLQDQTLTFSTGPSFQLQKDVSASVEYSNRWDKSPAAGSVGDEQRVSVSVKGTF